MEASVPRSVHKAVDDLFVAGLVIQWGLSCLCFMCAILGLTLSLRHGLLRNQQLNNDGGLNAPVHLVLFALAQGASSLSDGLADAIDQQQLRNERGELAGKGWPHEVEWLYFRLVALFLRPFVAMGAASVALTFVASRCAWIWLCFSLACMAAWVEVAIFALSSFEAVGLVGGVTALGTGAAGTVALICGRGGPGETPASRGFLALGMLMLLGALSLTLSEQLCCAGPHLSGAHCVPGSHSSRGAVAHGTMSFAVICIFLAVRRREVDFAKVAAVSPDTEATTDGGASGAVPQKVGSPTAAAWPA